MKSNLKNNVLPDVQTNHGKTIPDSLTGVKSIRTATLADADHHHGPMSYVTTSSSSSSSGNRNNSHSKTSHPTSSSTGGDDDIMNDVVQSTTVSQGDPVDFGGTGEH